MIRKARVLEVRRNTPHQVLSCVITAAPDVTESSAPYLPGTNCTAVSYPELLGEISEGDIIQIEVSVLAKSLGTGGAAMVLANETRLPDDNLPNPGHLVKARYTPHQKMVLGADEPDSPYYEILKDAADLGGLPVLVSDLHSTLPAIVAGYKHVRPDSTLAYIQTDGGALPLAYSRVVAELQSEKLLDATITCGQCYGGDFEAVSLPSALLVAALVVRSDAVIVAQGPGNLGTSTRWGYSGIGGAEALRAANALHGQPIGVLRMSNGDKRPRHYGISHHSLTMLTQLDLPPLDVVLPAFNARNPAEKPLAEPHGDFAVTVAQQTQVLEQYHRVLRIATDDLYEVLEQFPIRFSTMGRGLDADASAFLSAAAAGTYAAKCQAASRVTGDRP